MIKIVTLNLNYYNETYGAWPKRRELIVYQLEKINPHIVAFQAVAQHRNLFDGKDQALQISEATNNFYYHYYHHAQIDAEGQRQGNAVISRLPMAERSFHRFTLLNDPDDSNYRIVQRVAFEIENDRLVLYNAHFSWVEMLAQKNAGEVLALLRDDENAFTILAGDLNTAPDSSIFDAFRSQGFTDAWNMLHDDNSSGCTFPAQNPNLRIDYFWLSGKIKSKAHSVEVMAAPPDSNEKLSDHLGVVLSLNMNGFQASA